MSNTSQSPIIITKPITITINELDLQLVISQTGRTNQECRDALIKHDGDIMNSIMFLTYGTIVDVNIFICDKLAGSLK